MLTLPPIGQITPDNEAGAVEYLAALCEEAREARAEWEQFVDLNCQIYTYGDETTPDDNKIVVNEIQTAVISAVSVQMQEPPRCSLEPVETGEPGIFYWAGPPEIGGMLGLMPEEVLPWVDLNGVEQPPVPLDPQVAGRLKAVAIPEELSPALPPGAIRPDWVAELSDRTVAEVYQTVFDVMWERCSADMFIREYLLETAVQGFAWALYEFDDNALTHCLSSLPVPQVFIDPTVRDISRAFYAGFDMPFRADEAKRKYPHIADDIDAESYTGTPTRPGGDYAWGQAFDRDFKTPMVTFRVMWIRHQEVPLTPEEAIRLGEVQEVASPDANQVPADAANVGGPAGETDGLAAGEAAFGPSGEAGPDAVDQAPLPPDLGDDAAAEPLYVSTLTGLPLKPGDAEWPKRIGIRQITQIGPRVVDDRECEFADIPILHNINVPLPGLKPWGMGEPYRLKAIQMAQSRLLRAMVRSAEFNAAPIVAMSESMYALLPEEYKTAGVKPGQTIIVPDHLFEMMGGKLQSVSEPSPTPPALVELYPLLKAVLEEQSGHTDVMQGRSHAGDSGKKIELLQSSNMGMLGFKAKRTEDVCKSLAKQMNHSHVRRMKLADIKRIVSKYPDHLLEAIIDMAQDMEWNVKVEVHTGTGLQTQKKQLAQLELTAGIISMQTAREDSGRDHNLEKRRQLSEMQATAALGLAGPSQPGGEGSNESEPSGPEESSPPKAA